MRLLKGQRGAEMTEAALTLPVMLLVLFAIINLGDIAYEAQVAQAAARHGARMASVAQGTGNQAAVAYAEAARAAQATLRGNLVGVEVSPAAVGVYRAARYLSLAPEDWATAESLVREEVAAAILGGDPQAVQVAVDMPGTSFATPFTVRAEYPFQAAVPLVPGLSGRTLVAEHSMTVERYP